MQPDEIRKFLPADFVSAVSGYAWRRNRIGCSATLIFHLTATGKKSFYLKIEPRASKFSLLEEKRRLEWLKNRLPVPEVLLFAEDEAYRYLLISEIPGVPAIDDSLKSDARRTIGQIVDGLKMIHALSIEDCPFQTQLAEKIETARERCLGGFITAKDFAAARAGKSATDFFREMVAAVPRDTDSVFTHGDYCVPNVILNDGRLSGFIDWAEGGVADRFQDLALLARSIRYNFGEEYQKYVFERYGIEPDDEKIRFYLLLDDFF